MIEHRARRRLAVLAGLLGAGALLTTSATDAGARPTIVLEQSGTGAAFAIGGAAPVVGSHPSVSGDGRFYVAQGDPPDERTSTVYFTDRETNVTTEITAPPEGVRAGDTIHPVISGDGCTVVVVTEMALDVFRDDDTGERWDVYRARLPQCGGQLGGWELVSSRNDGSTLARDDVTSTDTPTVSRSGAVVAYTHPADHIIDGEGLTTISIVDLTAPIDAPDRSELVAGAPITSPNTTFTYGGLDQPALSGDGRYLAYRSDASSADAVPTWGPGLVAGGPAVKQIFVWDRDEADPFVAVRLMSVWPDGSPSTTGASEPVLSREGDVLAFTSNDPGLVPAVFPDCPETCPTQVFRLDRDVDDNGWYDEAGRTSITMVSAEAATTPPVAGVSSSFGPTLDASGQLVAFVTKAVNLQAIEAAGGGEATDGDVLLFDAAAGRLTRLSVSTDGIHPAVGANARPRLNDTGRTVVFDTLVAAELVVADPVAGTPAPGRNVVALSSQPRVTLAEADLGTTLPGFPSDEWYVAVINTGTSSFVPARVSVNDGRFSINQDGSTCSLGIAVPPGADCTVKLSFTPNAPGPVSATLTVAEEGFHATEVTSRVRGTGGDPTLRIDPAGTDLGDLVVGTAGGEFVFDVQNISLVPTTISEVVVQGADWADFQVTSNNCANRPLNPRATCTVGVAFTPTGAGRRTAVVRVATPAGQYSTMVVAGDGHFEPTLELPATEVIAGDDVTVLGHSFPPNSYVAIVWGDRAGQTTIGTTNPYGELSVDIAVASNDPGGTHRVVGTVVSPTATIDRAVATGTLTVVPGLADDLVGLPGYGLG